MNKRRSNVTTGNKLSDVIMNILQQHETFGCSAEYIKDEIVKYGFHRKGTGSAIQSLISSGKIHKDSVTDNYIINKSDQDPTSRIKQDFKSAISTMKPEEIADWFEFLWSEVQRLNKICEEWQEAHERMWGTAKKAQEYKLGRNGNLTLEGE